MEMWAGVERPRWLEEYTGLLSEDEVVPPTPDTIDNEPGGSVLERCLTTVHGEPILKFLGPEDLLHFGAVSKEAIQAVQDHLAFCEPEHYWRFFDMLKHFLQTTLINAIRQNYLRFGRRPSHVTLFLTRSYVIDYVTGDLKQGQTTTPLNFLAPGPFSQGLEADFVEYLRETYSLPFLRAHFRDLNKMRRKWELPYRDDDAMFSKFAAFMESQLVHVSKKAARVRVAWWYNRRMRFVWAFMHQPLCGLCGDSNSPITRAICGQCERPYCRDGLNVIVCRACHDHKREEFERELAERHAAQRRLQAERRLFREMESARRAIDMRRDAKRQRRNASRGAAEEEEEEEEEEPLLVGLAARAREPRYQCPLGDHACQRYGHEGQECPCPCHGSGSD